jgi:hypothetical protein
MSHCDFSTIAIGDTVILNYDYGRKRRLCKVIKVTKTQITIEGNRVFSRRYGTERGYGQSYDSPSIAIPTGDDIANVTAEQERRDAVGKYEAAITKVCILLNHKNTNTESIKAVTKLLHEAARLLAAEEPGVIE